MAGSDKSLEERVRREGPGLEFRMELATQEPGVIAQLDHLHKVVLGVSARERQPEAGQPSPLA
jgi:hypothetical protein